MTHFVIIINLTHIIRARSRNKRDKPYSCMGPLLPQSIFQRVAHSGRSLSLSPPRQQEPYTAVCVFIYQTPISFIDNWSTHQGKEMATPTGRRPCQPWHRIGCVLAAAVRIQRTTDLRRVLHHSPRRCDCRQPALRGSPRKAEPGHAHSRRSQAPLPHTQAQFHSRQRQSGRQGAATRSWVARGSVIRRTAANLRRPVA
jgi:hypothetical protein